MPRKLDETLNLVNLYLHHCGESEIPEDFHLWCCLSMIAALVGDRVWYEKFIGRKLTPNLYVALLGPSGIGKGDAIDTSMKFIKDNPRVNMYAGSITAQALARRMSAHRGDGVGRGKIYLVSPELAQSLGRGERADGFIQHMTELYTGRDYPMRGDTISRGETLLKEYCLEGDTEVLTREGWIRFDNLGEKVELAQYENGTIDWCVAAVHKIPFAGGLVHLSAFNHDCTYTPDHRVLGVDGVHRAHTIEGRIRIPVSGFLKNGSDFPPIRLLEAVRADGQVQNRRVYFAFKKQRKINRLLELCRILDVPIKVVESSRPGVVRLVIWGQIVETIISMLGRPKGFGPWLTDLSSKTLMELIDEFRYWDGVFNPAIQTRLTTKSLSNASWAATAAHLAGKRAHISSKPHPLSRTYTVSFTNEESVHAKRVGDKTFRGVTYCVTTPSGFFLARKNRHIFVTGNCINWIFGSTKEWLTRSVPKEMMLGGFIGRVAIITASYDLDKRVEDPLVPEDYDEVTDYIMQRVEELAHVEGSFRITDEARGIRTHWYNTREKPTDDNLIASWKREDDLVLKLAMVLSLADSLDLCIHKNHMAMAQRLTGRALKAVPALITASAETQETAGLEGMRAFIKQRQIVPHSALIQFASRNGMNAERARHHVDQLIQERVVDRIPTQRGLMYEWKERRR